MARGSKSILSSTISGRADFYVRLARTVTKGTKLVLAVRLSPAPGKTTFAPIVAFRGVVQRSESTADGKCGLAVLLTHNRFL